MYRMGGYYKTKIAVVTGASSGIGACIAKKLANNGMIVIGMARRADLIEDLNKDVTNNNGKIIPKYCDLSNTDTLIETFNWIRTQFGNIDVFVNNAGIMRAKLLIDSTNEDIQSQFDLNVVSSCVSIRETLNIMKDNGSKGHIVMINSILGHEIPDLPIPLFNVYPATKHALTALCQSIRQEIVFSRLKVKLTNISPGMVETDLLNVYRDSPIFVKLPKLSPDDVAEAVFYALSAPDNVQIENITLQAMVNYD